MNGEAKAVCYSLFPASARLTIMERFSVNQMIGDYRITAFLGAGGMGEVYLGNHVKLGRWAAIKVLSGMSPASASSLTDRFFNEARVQSSIQHPNIAALYDFQEIGGKLFIFMEFVDGESLEDLVKRRAFTVGDALATFQSICEAVAFLHERGIVHRDIKAPNIKLTSGGTIKLLDFGIAKDAASANLTKVGGVIGTPRYLAPEQLSGEPANRQTDIWALGILLYEMLTGVEPFESDSILTLYGQIKDARFERPEKLNPAVTRGASRVVSGCLTVNPAERYQTVDELILDVRRALNQPNEAKIHAKASRFLRKSSGVSGEQASGANFAENFSDALPSPRRKTPLAAVAAGSIAGVLLLFSFVGIGIWAMGDSGNYQANNSAIVVAPDKSPAKPNGINSPVRQRSAKTKPVHIDSFEGSAQVFRNGQQIGVTPLDLEVEDGEKIELTLKRDGFDEKQINFQVSPGQRVYTFALKSKH